MRRLLLLFALSLLGLNSALSLDRDYGRQRAITDHGSVVTSHVLASQAGAQILSQGASAIDAAIAANTVLEATEPASRFAIRDAGEAISARFFRNRASHRPLTRPVAPFRSK